MPFIYQNLDLYCGKSTFSKLKNEKLAKNGIKNVVVTYI